MVFASLFTHSFILVQSSQYILPLSGTGIFSSFYFCIIALASSPFPFCFPLFFSRLVRSGLVRSAWVRGFSQVWVYDFQSMDEVFFLPLFLFHLISFLTIYYHTIQ